MKKMGILEGGCDVPFKDPPHTGTLTLGSRHFMAADGTQESPRALQKALELSLARQG